MATITFSVSNGGNTVNLSKSLTFPDGDLTRLAAWARATYKNDDGSQPTNQVAWDRVSLALAKGLLANVKRFEDNQAAATAIGDVPPVGDPT